MKATDYIVDVLAQQGIKVIFGYQGGNIAHLIDSICKRDDMRFVSTYNEQGASFSACGYSLEKGTLGVALASSGPGAINLISGIANSYYDSIPCLFITGNVSTSSMKRFDDVRQNAFQENDIVSMVSKVTKYAVTISDPHKIRYHLEKAIYLSQTGRQGPVLLDLPHDIQKVDLDFDKEEGYCTSENNEIVIETECLQNVIERVKNSIRPIMVVGGGASRAKKQLSRLLERWKIPVVSTLRGLDVIPHNNECYLGFGGAYGNRCSNYALKYSDLMLVFGARLDERFISLSDKQTFENKIIIHVDIDNTELGRVFESELSILSDIKCFLDKLLEGDIPKLTFPKWFETVNNWKRRYPSLTDKWSVNRAVYELTRDFDRKAVFTLDIGINQMCAAQTLYLHDDQNCYTSAGHGAMGCSLPLAIGAAYANMEKTVTCFVGDGAFLMNIQEMLVLSRDHLPVHVVLNNNSCLGMIRDYQTKVFDSKFTATVEEFCNINYEKIAESYGIKYYRVDSDGDMENAKKVLLSKEPCLVELVYCQEENTNPMIGRDMFHQLPLLSEEEENAILQEALS